MTRASRGVAQKRVGAWKASDVEKDGMPGVVVGRALVQHAHRVTAGEHSKESLNAGSGALTAVAVDVIRRAGAVSTPRPPALGRRLRCLHRFRYLRRR